MGTLYIVPTPIGNLEDMTLRALRILREVVLIAAEDTRTTRVLLDHYQITTPMTSYHEHNKIGKLDAIFDALLRGDVALVSDAGMPGISDPGYELIQTAIQRGYTVSPLPGASAIITAVVGSGLPTDGFVFLGFLPKKNKARLELLGELAEERRTLVAYENPYRVTETLEAVLEALGDRPVCVARELSKLFEEFYRGSASAALAYYEQQPPKGEVTLVIGGFTGEKAQSWDEARVRHELLMRMENGLALSKAAKLVAAESGWDKRDVYALGVERGTDGEN